MNVNENTVETNLKIGVESLGRGGGVGTGGGHFTA